MGKRSSYEKKPRDKYYTIDPAAFERFPRHVLNYAEPCCGDGSLIDGFIKNDINRLECYWASDIDPEAGFPRIDALELGEGTIGKSFVDAIVTNPPYTKSILLPLIDHFIHYNDTWLLLPADIMHNKYFGPYMRLCEEVHSIGRLYWEENKVRGVDNYCWFFFPHNPDEVKQKYLPVFYGRE